MHINLRSKTQNIFWMIIVEQFCAIFPWFLGLCHFNRYCRDLKNKKIFKFVVEVIMANIWSTDKGAISQYPLCIFQNSKYKRKILFDELSWINPAYSIYCVEWIFMQINFIQITILKYTGTHFICIIKKLWFHSSKNPTKKSEKLDWEMWVK